MSALPQDTDDGFAPTQFHDEPLPHLRPQREEPAPSRLLREEPLEEDEFYRDGSVHRVERRQHTRHGISGLFWRGRDDDADAGDTGHAQQGLPAADERQQPLPEAQPSFLRQEPKAAASRAAAGAAAPTGESSAGGSSAAPFAILALVVALVCGGWLAARHFFKAAPLPTPEEQAEAQANATLAAAPDAEGPEALGVVALERLQEAPSPSTGAPTPVTPSDPAIAETAASPVQPTSPAPAPQDPAPVATAAPAVPTSSDAVAQVGINAGFAAAITQLQADVAALKGRQAAPAATGSATDASSTPAPARRVVRVRPAPVPQVSEQEAARQAALAAQAAEAAQARGAVLAVDLWDGRPSVVVGTGSPQDRRVQFLLEGDRRNGITLKAADVRRQEAVFDVNGQRATYTAEGQARN